MEYHDPIQVMWREGGLRCELWDTDTVSELRVYGSNVLKYREPVLNNTEIVHQAASLLTIAQADIGSGLEGR